MKIKKDFKYLVLFAFITLLSIQPSKCGWISNLIFGGIKNKIEDLGRNLIGEAKQAFQESMDYLFDNKIVPLVNQLEATADRVMDHAKDDINQIIDNFTKQMENLVETAFNKANEFIGKTVDEIKSKIIDATFDRLNEFESQLFQDMTTILNKIDEMLKEVSCFAQAIVQRITDEIKKALPYIINPFETCRKELDKLFPSQYMRIKPLSGFTPNQLYEYRKCNLIYFIDEHTPIKTILMAYRDVELLAGDMRCLSVSLGAIGNEKYYIKEMGDAAHILSIFSRVKSEFSKRSLKFLD